MAKRCKEMKEVVMVKKWKYRSMEEALMRRNSKLEKGIIEKEYDGREVSYHGTSEYETIRVIRDEAGKLYKCSDMAKGYEKKLDFIEADQFEAYGEQLSKRLDDEIQELQKLIEAKKIMKNNIRKNIQNFKNRC